MDEIIIQNWNRVVKPTDHIYHLGDVTMWRGNHMKWEFIRMIKSLNGHKRLILGNHDHYPVQTYLDAGFEKIRGTGQWFNGFLLSHYPVHPDSLGKAKACIHGHIHNNQSSTRVQRENGSVIPYINVSVEVINYTPVNIETYT